MINSDSVTNQGRDCTFTDSVLIVGTFGFSLLTGGMILTGETNAARGFGAVAGTLGGALFFRAVYQCNEGVRTACQNLAAKAKQLLCCKNTSATKAQVVADQVLSESNSSGEQV